LKVSLELLHLVLLHWGAW
jgi:hypothetical protein